jgi:coenzyme F420-reducing hydrogenase gamma subunit
MKIRMAVGSPLRQIKPRAPQAPSLEVMAGAFRIDRNAILARPAPSTSGRVTHQVPRIGVVKFASCDGCQLTLLDLEDALLSIAARFHVVEFPEATSARSAGPYDVLFVEGSVSEPEHVTRIAELRKQAKLLVTIGACATSGGIQALRNWADHDEFRRGVYAHPEYIHALATATPIAQHVKVDAELRGCPIDPGQLLEFLTAVITRRRPQLRDEAVCMECKRAGAVCVMSAKGVPCLGQVTQAGCGAICPRYGRGCYGCFGPREQANAAGLVRHFTTVQKLPGEEASRLFAGFTAWSEPFRAAATEFAGKRTAEPKKP